MIERKESTELLLKARRDVKGACDFGDAKPVSLKPSAWSMRFGNLLKGTSEI